MRNKLIIILFFLIQSALAFGQITITGKILSKEDSTGMPGVLIREFGTANKVIADLNGNYKIMVSDTTKFLEYVYVGFASRKVPINGQTVINTSLKPYQIYEAFDQKIGLFLQSGLVNTPCGTRFYFSTPIVGSLSVGFQVAYMTDFKLNQRIDAGLSLSGFRFMLGPGSWLYGSVDFNYRKWNINNMIDLVSYSIENYAKLYGHTIILGLGKMDYSSEKSYNNSKFGIIAGYKKDFRKLDYLTLTYKMGFYHETIDYYFQINVPIKRVKPFVAFNKFDNYHELLIGIGFNTYYFYRYQKNRNKYE